MNLSLFIVVLGGRIVKSNIEIHDVRWVLGETLEDTFPELRKQWIGEINGLHIDSYKRIEYVNGYKITITKSNKKDQINKNKETESLWFINLGGYDPRNMYEEHEFSLVVAKKAIEARKKAKSNWIANLKSKHNDNFSDINNFEQIDNIHSIKKIKSWDIKLIPDPCKRNEKLIPDWNGYMRIDKY